MLLSAVLIEVLPVEELCKPAAASEEQRQSEMGNSTAHDGVGAATESTPLLDVSRNHSD